MSHFTISLQQLIHIWNLGHVDTDSCNKSQYTIKIEDSSLSYSKVHLRNKDHFMVVQPNGNQIPLFTFKCLPLSIYQICYNFMSHMPRLGHQQFRVVPVSRFAVKAD